MNEQDSFDFSRYGIRPVVFDGVRWFSATEVCRALNLKNPKVVVSRLDDSDVMLKPHRTAGGVQRCLMLSEPGLYALLLASHRPVAKEFQRYVCGVMTAVGTAGENMAERQRGEGVKAA